MDFLDNYRDSSGRICDRIIELDIKNIADCLNKAGGKSRLVEKFLFSKEAKELLKWQI